MTEQRGVYYEQAARQPPPDPLNLCIFATVALLTWLIGPWALTGFALLAFTAYWRAWRQGLRRSKCWLRDTRLVLLYLAALAALGVYAALR
ncbi:hypothetical protein [Nocardia goodfellowii]|uniref:Uncharacterized protein n=1 Tax=Nocardia goodfellowii TaxID=882446 RepID=A0ABS4QK62_9NOCA|nr:hypothetical protein [Nocardia goodfellowii]MBP2192090.1 hypothetical protein [Nocardia goodfellowii]